MKKRLLTSLEIVLVLALAFVLKILVSDYFFDALILLVACFAAFETSKMFTKMGKYNLTYLATFFPVILLISNLVGMAYDATIGLTFTLLIDIALIVVFFGIAFLWTAFNTKKSLNEMKIRKISKEITLTRYSFNKAFNTAVTFIYPSFLLMFMTFLNHLDSLTSTFENMDKFGGYLSLTVLIFMFLIPIFTDTFAYITGGLIGGKKLAPKISPNKTIAGAVGGTIWCVLLSVCVYLILNAINPIYTAFSVAGFQFWHIILISLFGSIICQLGDLFESFLKRKAEIKDSGKIFPGHGGMLDRFDSYVFVAPYLLLAFGILVLVI